MAGWGKLLTGVVIGVAGTVYATNEEVRKQLPEAARDLPETVRRRFNKAVEAAREGASNRRQEILHALEQHEANNATPPAAVVPREELSREEPSRPEPAPEPEPTPERAPEPAFPETEERVTEEPLARDETGPIYRPTRD